MDTVRADFLGAWGHPTAWTPAIDGLAGSGMRFARAITPAPSTSAAHASVMTGLYPHHHGVANNFRALGDEAVTLAESLRGAGWWTAAAIGAQPLASDSGLLQGFEAVDERFDIAVGDSHDQAQRRAAAVVDAALALADQRPPDRPMLLFVHLFDAHFPYDGYPDLRGDLPENVGSLAHVTEVRGQLAVSREDGRSGSDQLRRAYLAEIEGMDREIGRLMERLGARSQVDPMVWLFADHGEAQDEHIEAWDHGFSVFEESVHVPLIARFPGAATGVAPGVVSLVDVLPTTLGWLGLPVPRGDGEDLSPLLRSEDELPARTVYTEATQPHRRVSGWANGESWAALRADDVKWMHDPSSGRGHLFAIGDDPGESQDLAPSDLERARAYRSRLDAWRARALPASTSARGRRTTSLLEALGYVAP